jgi:hypothetical protein
MKTHPSWDQDQRQKFSQNMTTASFFCISAFFLYRILANTDWLWIPELWSANLHDDGNAKHVIQADFKLYYLLYLARFCSDSVSMFYDIRRKVKTRYVYNKAQEK